MRRDTPEGLGKSRRLLTACLSEAARGAGLGLGDVVLGGFSQGAMLSLDTALRLDEAVAGLVLLSGTLISEEEWRRRAALRRGLPVLQAHGRQDPLLPYAAAEALRDLLVQQGLDVDFRAFEGGHTITLDVLRGVTDLLERVLAARR